jgi:hypothetical protein
MNMKLHLQKTMKGIEYAMLNANKWSFKRFDNCVEKYLVMRNPQYNKNPTLKHTHFMNDKDKTQAQQTSKKLILPPKVPLPQPTRAGS